MGERTAGLNGAPTLNRGNGTSPPSARDATRQLEGDIAALREELGALVGELDRRRHELVDVKLQLKRHGGSAALFGVALVGTAAGFVWLGMWRARRDQKLLSRAGRLREAVARMVDRPERVAAEPTVPTKILTAAATAAVATLVKKGLERLGHALLESSYGPRVRLQALPGRDPWTHATNGPARPGDMFIGSTRPTGDG